MGSSKTDNSNEATNALTAMLTLFQLYDNLAGSGGSPKMPLTGLTRWYIIAKSKSNGQLYGDLTPNVFNYLEELMKDSLLSRKEGFTTFCLLKNDPMGYLNKSPSEYIAGKVQLCNSSVEDLTSTGFLCFQLYEIKTVGRLYNLDVEGTVNGYIQRHLDAWREHFVPDNTSLNCRSTIISTIEKSVRESLRGGYNKMELTPL